MIINDNSNIRILIIDDDPVSRSLMEGILKPEGYTIKVMDSGVQLLEHLETYRPDVLLMDVLMPDIDGYALCRQIKADQHWQHLPIVLVTSLNSDTELVTGLDAGADEFISKPVSATKLKARVRSMSRMKQRADLLLRMTQMREDLAHMVVHDMRTPLSVCLLRTDILLGLIDKDKMQTEQLMQHRPNLSLRNSLTLIKNQLENLNSLVDDILLVAKTEHDTLMLNKEDADLRDIVQLVTADYKELAARERIGMQVELPAAPRNRPLDVNLVTRMIGNLLGNAVKFSPPNSTVTLRLDNDSNGRWILDVMDEGPGIPIEDRERIFDRYAVASTHSKGVRSLGLGLAYCKMVAEAHGGCISVKDNAPQGAILRVHL